MGLTAGMVYNVSVYARATSESNLRVHVCEDKLASQLLVELSPALPTGSPVNVSVVSVNETHVGLRWFPPAIASSGGLISSYTVVSRLANSVGNALEHTLSVPMVYRDRYNQSELSLPVALSLALQVLAVDFTVSIAANTLAGSGPASQIVARTQGIPLVAPTCHTPKRTPTSLTLDWSALNASEARGTIVSYVVRYLVLRTETQIAAGCSAAHPWSMVNISAAGNGSFQLDISDSFAVAAQVGAQTIVGIGPYSFCLLIPGGSGGAESSGQAGVLTAALAGSLCLLALMATAIILVIRRNKNALHFIPQQQFAAHSIQQIKEEMKGLEVTREHVSIIREIATGAFGRVYEACATHLPSDSNTTGSAISTVAVKYLKEGVDSAESDYFIKEAYRHMHLRHENVLALIGVCFTSEPYFIVTAHMLHGDLKSFLAASNNTWIERSHLLQWGTDVAQALKYFASMNFVHRDIAARNVLLNDKYTAVVADFGLSQQLYLSDYYVPSKLRNWMLPLRWMAPESFYDGVWDEHTDIYSFGVLLWEIFSRGQTPWADMSDSVIMPSIRHQKARLQQPRDCPDALYSGMDECWSLDRHMRPSAAAMCATLNALTTTTPLTWPNPLHQQTPAHSTLQSTQQAQPVDTPSTQGSLEPMEVSRSCVAIERDIGTGAFGSVSQGKLVRADASTVACAVKVLSSSEQELKSKFLAEAQLLAQLQHPRIVTLLAVCTTSEPFLLVMELMHGDLRRYLQTYVTENNKYFQGEDYFVVIQQICEAMVFLAARSIVHRDLAARNVLVSASGHSVVKLADLGLSRTLSDSLYYRKRSDDKVPIKWTALEAILDRKYTISSDIWSFGVLCWEVFSMGEAPFKGMTAESLLLALKRGHRLPHPPTCPENMYLLMLKCWDLEPTARPSFPKLAMQIQMELDDISCTL
eukprot:m.374554 g.374554  ORF g.374554 m.374554 type:complete len:926 (-) comp56166_c0_seq1:359-3136(-)